MYNYGLYAYGSAYKAVDGNYDTRPEGYGCSYADTTYNYTPYGGPAWWQVELDAEYDVIRVIIYTAATRDRGKIINYSDLKLW